MLKIISVLFSAWKIPVGFSFMGQGGVRFQFSYFIKNLLDNYMYVVELALGTGVFLKVREIEMLASLAPSHCYFNLRNPPMYSFSRCDTNYIVFLYIMYNP